MIVVLNVYRIKYEKAEKALSLWREGIAISSLTNDNQVEIRLLTDSLGTYFTIMIEVTADSLEAYDEWTREVLGNREYGSWYQEFVNLTVGRYREVFNLIDQTSQVPRFRKRWTHIAD